MRLFAAAAALLTFSLTGCFSAPGKPGPAPVPPSQIASFHTLYSTNCAACHGEHGKSGPSMDLANPEFQAIISDADLRNIVANGMPGTEMPAWAKSAGGMLTDKQVDIIVKGMRQRWYHPAVFSGVTPPPYAADKPGDPKRGEQAYQAHCLSCHTGHARQQVTSPVYLALVSDQALRTIIIAGRPDIGQPDWRHDNGQPLTPQDVDDIVAYLHSLRNPDAVSAAPIPNLSGEQK
jgi:mono/diheme cytochrome c family protein